MKFQTFSIVAGSTACNACCPYCVSRMTEKPGDPTEVAPDGFYAERLSIASRLAKSPETKTALITGIGEPTLDPDHISVILRGLDYDFPIVELQTNGIELHDKYLREWRILGLTTICLSCVSPYTHKNREIFGDAFVALQDNILKLKKHRYSIRLSYVGLRGVNNGWEDILGIIRFSKNLKVNQTTWRPVYSKNPAYQYGISAEYLSSMVEKADQEFHHLLTLPHGAKVYDADGVNFCLSNCLTRTVDPNEIRQVILFPDGTIGYDWDRPGAVIL